MKLSSVLKLNVILIACSFMAHAGQSSINSITGVIRSFNSKDVSIWQNGKTSSIPISKITNPNFKPAVGKEVTLYLK